jgi:hypothetical protein
VMVMVKLSLKASGPPLGPRELGDANELSLCLRHRRSEISFRQV